MSLPELALSVRQPWAWAIIHAGKNIENRSWQAINHGLKRRGRICIHASQGMTQYEYESTRRFMSDIGVDCPPPNDLSLGAIVGTVEVVDVVSEHDSPWFMGPRGLVLEYPKALDCPNLVKGQLGYFKWKLTDQPVPSPKPWMEWWPEKPQRRPSQKTQKTQETPDMFGDLA